MKIYLVRHSIPEPRDEDDPEDDPGLTKEGRELVEALAKWMRDADEMPTIIISSPSQRTLETAQILRDNLDVLPDVQVDLTIAPQTSIRGLVKRVAADKSMVRVCIVSHHESMAMGLRELNRDPWVHLDQFAQGELRIMRVDRETANWEEHNRMLPSDYDLIDHY